MAEKDLRLRLKDDFRYYASHALKIRTKEGAIRPLVLNRAQLEIHDRLERVKRAKGRLRVLFLKARQLGISTYVEARFFHQVTHRFGVRAFILTHQAEATGNLFGMARRFQENLPSQLMPALGASSSRELSFSDLDSGYKVGTAGTEGVGRSDTIQYFHGSEVAFWPKAEEHAAGALQAVPNEVGTEIFLESTANGLGGLFHEMWQDATRGISEYTPIFLPWFWDPQYRMDATDFELTDDEQEEMELYNLDLEQMAWRRNKIQDLRSDWLFRQEYPANAEEAFQTSGAETLIQSHDVFRARRCEIQEPYGALVVGVDPARFGDDDTAIIRRTGRRAHDLERHSKLSVPEVASLCARIIEDESPERMFVDQGGLGAGVVDLLFAWGYGRVVTGVNFGAKPMNSRRYYNLRAEMWGNIKEWLTDLPCDLPDDDALHADLCSPMFSYTNIQQIKLESKEDMRKRGLKSPDGGDCLGLTFAYPVRALDAETKDRYAVRGHRRQGSWMGI